MFGCAAADSSLAAHLFSYIDAFGSVAPADSGMALPGRCTLVDPAVRSRQLSTRQARALRKSGGSCYGHVARCFDDDFARDEDCAKLLDGASLLVGMCALIGKSPVCVRCLTG